MCLVSGRTQNDTFIEWAKEKGKEVNNESFKTWCAERTKEKIKNSKNLERYVLSGAAQKKGKQTKQHWKNAQNYLDESWLQDDIEQEGNFSDSTEPDEFEENEKKLDKEEKKIKRKSRKAPAKKKAPSKKKAAANKKAAAKKKAPAKKAPAKKRKVSKKDGDSDYDPNAPVRKKQRTNESQSSHPAPVSQPETQPRRRRRSSRNLEKTKEKMAQQQKSQNDPMEIESGNDGSGEESDDPQFQTPAIPAGSFGKLPVDEAGVKKFARNLKKRKSKQPIIWDIEKVQLIPVGKNKYNKFLNAASAGVFA